MDLKKALDTINKGLAFADDLSPLLSAFGVPQAKNIIGIVEAVAALAANVMERINEGQIVATSTQKAELEAILASIQAKNDALAKVILAS